MNLRAWQAEALPLVASTLRQGRPALVSACTGAGKSIFLAALLSDVCATLRPGWVIVVTVPTEALVEQLAATLREHLPSVGRWYGKRKEASVVRVCCLPSLATLVASLAEEGTRCALWVGDEVHRAEAYVEPLEALAPRCRMGLTATPYRSDTGLSLWPELTYRYTVERAISEGVLVPPRIVPWEGGHKVEVLDALRQMLHHVAGLPGVIGAATIADAEAMVLPIRTAPIHSEQPQHERARLLARLQRGELDALIHVRLLSEGVDLPWLRWLAITTRHSRTKLGLVQEVGRVLRCAPGKTEAIVLDPLGLCLRVGLVHPADLVAAADAAESEEREPSEPQDEREPPPAVHAIPVDSLQRWLLRERWQRLRPDAPRPGPGAATDKQIDALTKARKKLRWLTGDTRIAVERLMAQPEIDRRTAGAILDMLYEASRQAAEHYRAAGEWHGAPRLDWGTPT